MTNTELDAQEVDMERIYPCNKAGYTTNISRERWAGALMEVRSLFGLNSETRDQQTDRRTDRRMDGPTDGRTKPRIESLVRD